VTFPIGGSRRSISSKSLRARSIGPTSLNIGGICSKRRPVGSNLGLNQFVMYIIALIQAASSARILGRISATAARPISISSAARMKLVASICPTGRSS